MISEWLEEIKRAANPGELGMVLVHNGVVRATSKLGCPVRGMNLSYDEQKLNALVSRCKARAGIVDVKAWINSGTLKVGDDIMCLVVAGRFKTDVFPVLEELLSSVKKEIVKEKEIP